MHFLFFSHLEMDRLVTGKSDYLKCVYVYDCVCVCACVHITEGAQMKTSNRNALYLKLTSKNPVSFKRKIFCPLIDMDLL